MRSNSCLDRISVREAKCLAKVRGESNPQMFSSVTARQQHLPATPDRSALTVTRRLAFQPGGDDVRDVRAAESFGLSCTKRHIVC